MFRLMYRNSNHSDLISCEWSLEDKKISPLFVGTVVLFSASDKELEFIRDNFKNIPDLKSPISHGYSVVWYGDMANFIHHNLWYKI